MPGYLSLPKLPSRGHLGDLSPAPNRGKPQDALLQRLDELQMELQSYVYSQMQDLREDLLKDLQHAIAHDTPPTGGSGGPFHNGTRSGSLRSLRQSNSMGSNPDIPPPRDLSRESLRGSGSQVFRESTRDGEEKPPRASSSQSPGGSAEARRSKKRPTRMMLRSFNAYVGGEGPQSDTEETPSMEPSQPSFGRCSVANETEVIDIDEGPIKELADSILEEPEGGDAQSPLLSEHRYSRSQSKGFARTRTGTSEFEGSWEDDADDPDAPVWQKRLRRTRRSMDRCIHSHAFEHMVGCAIVLSSVLLGAEVDYAARNLNSDTPMFYKVVDILFALFFLAEIGARICVHRWRFFTMIGKEWNIFDLGMVLLQVVDVSIQALDSLSHFDLHHGGSHVSAMRVLRVLRMVRMLRIFRTFSLFSELRIMVASMSAAIGSLIWSMLLQLVMVYVFAVIFMQVVTGRRRKDDNETLEYWFGSLSRSMLTMTESILGGVSWDEIVNPLIEDISPVMGSLFVFYVAASMFAMMNLVTGVFVTEVLNKVNEDKDDNFISELNGIISGDGNETQITKEEFVRRAHKETAMLKYLKSLDIHPADSNYIFEVLDADDNGTLDRQELMEAFLRLRGPARNVDMQVLRREVQDLADRVDILTIPPVVEIAEEAVLQADMDSQEAGLAAVSQDDGLRVLTKTVDPAGWPFVVARRQSPNPGNVMEPADDSVPMLHQVSHRDDAVPIMHQFSHRRRRHPDLLAHMQQDGIEATNSLRAPLPVVLTRRVSPNPAASAAPTATMPLPRILSNVPSTFDKQESPVTREDSQRSGQAKFRRQNSGNEDSLDGDDAAMSSTVSFRRRRTQVSDTHEEQHEEQMLRVMSHNVSGRLRRQASKLLSEEALEAIAMKAHEEEEADSSWRVSPAPSHRKSRVFSAHSEEEMIQMADGAASFGI